MKGAVSAIFLAVLLAFGLPTSSAFGQENAVRSTVNGSYSLPVGTQIQIRTNEAIDAQQTQTGRTYSADTAQRINDQSGRVVIPKGSPVELTVAKAESSTLGSNQLALAIRSINVNGHTYMVDTGNVEQGNDRGLGKNKRTAEMVGGGALLGTVVGAIAGGGKGAAIGALVGGGGGAAAQVITKGNKISVPAESLLTFKLDQPLQLRP